MIIDPQEFIASCKNALNYYWGLIEKHSLNTNFVDEDIVTDVKECIRSKTKTYRYVLPTQILAKIVNPNLDCKCVQVKRLPGNGNFDARSLNVNVIVKFERDIGSPLGGSPEPYVNNPLRVEEITLKYLPAQKDKLGWETLCRLLEQVEHKQDAKFTESVLMQVLIEIRKLQEEMDISYAIPKRISLHILSNVLGQYLDPSSGGARLQAVILATFKTMMKLWGTYDKVESTPVNVADTQSGRPADITCEKDGSIILAVEVKDRTVTVEMVEDKINSARLSHVQEVMFLIRANQLYQNEDVYDRAGKEFASGGNIYLLDANKFLDNLLALVGESGREVFMQQVCISLDEVNLDFSDKKAWGDLLSKC